MELPGSNELNELNRILIAVAELTDQDQGCSVNSVTTLCSSFTLGGRLVDHAKMLRLSSYTGLSSIEQGTVRLTNLGREFLSGNPNFLYEITETQEIFLAEQLIFKGPWESRARDLFLSFSPNYSKITYELSLIENPLPVRYNSTIHLLRVLEVLVEADGKLIVAPRYVAHVNQLLADRRRVSEKLLEQALQANQRLGMQAEEAVVEHERKRLRALGRNAEAELVRRISQLDIGAGYDIESFDGDKPLFDYDRFIEVKASQKSELRFFWSANERRAAKEKGNTYWIYFVGHFKQSKSDEITPIMIQSPAKRLSQISQLSVDVATYIVTQCNDLPLNPISYKNVK
ncbi:MAG: DUF3883 domain-containing protein [bacterium]